MILKRVSYFKRQIELSEQKKLNMPLPKNEGDNVTLITVLILPIMIILTCAKKSQIKNRLDYFRRFLFVIYTKVIVKRAITFAFVREIIG